MNDLYIYYKVPDADAVALQAVVIAMQASLARRHGVTPQLKRRPEDHSGLQTWMEIYPQAPQGFQEALDSAADQAGLASWIAGPRHTEIFTDLIPCA
jgi:hypothetical protein